MKLVQVCIFVSSKFAYCNSLKYFITVFAFSAFIYVANVHFILADVITIINILIERSYFLVYFYPLYLFVNLVWYDFDVADFITKMQGILIVW